MGSRSVSCERTHALVSRALDGEISDFEQRTIRTHLHGCVDCEIYADQVRAFTGMLRAAPYEPLPRPMIIPRRRRAPSITRIGSAAAAAVVAFGVGSVVAFDVPQDQQPYRAADSVPSPTEAQLLDDRLNWPGGFPRVKTSELPLPIGQRAVSSSSDNLPTPGPASP